MDDNKHSISISAKLYKDIKDYCTLNGLKLNTFVEGLLRKAFTVEKFGEAPFINIKATGTIEPAEPKPVKQLRDEYAELIESAKKVDELPKNDIVVMTEPVKEEETKKPIRKITRLN